MGVTNLWQILDPTSKPIRVETLYGKKLAIDASIWLYQFVKAMRDSKGETLQGAHLVGFLRRICKLLFHGIKPVFVFDGQAPELKKQTIQARRARRSEAKDLVEKTAEKVLRAQLKLHGLEALGGLNPVPVRLNSTVHDEYELPNESTIVRNDTEIDQRLATETEIQDFIENQRQFLDYTKIDINSVEFQALPITLQHEIILDLKNKSRQPSQSRVEEMLKYSKTALDFSKSQLKNMIHRHTLTDRYHQTLKTNIVQKRVVGSRQKEYVLVKKDGRGWEMTAKQVEAKAVVDLTGLEGFTTYSKGTSHSSGFVGDDYVDDDVDLEEIMKKIQDISDYSKGKGLLEKYLVEGTGGDCDELDPFQLDSPQLDCNLDPSVWARNWNASMPDGFETTYPNHTDLLSIMILSKSKESLAELKKSVTKRIDKSSGEKVRHHSFYLEFVESAILVKEQMGQEDLVCKREEIGIASLEKGKKRGLVIDTDSESDSDSHSGMVEEFVVKGTELPVQVQAMKDVNASSLGLFDEPSVFQESIFNIDKQTIDQPKEIIQISSEDDEEWEAIPIVTPVKGTEKVSSIPQNTLVTPTKRNIEQVGIDDEFGPIVDPFSTPLQSKTTPLPFSAQRKGSIVTIDSDAESDLSRLSNEAKRQLEFQNDQGLENIGVPELIPTELDEYYSDLKFTNVEQLRQQTESELLDLYSQHRNNLRDHAQVSPQMIQETQELLRLFGIPFLTAPMEAESQCAFLLMKNLVDGIVTDDSDVFLFGGTLVYKNLFDSKKYVERFTMEGINEIGLDRVQLIQMAFLLGSDYTTGIRGLGPVSSVEVVTTWESNDLEGLKKFKEWALDLQKGNIDPNDGSVQKRLRSYCKKIEFSDSFPDQRVFDAYMDPTVDESLEPFVWGVPLLDPIRAYFALKLGWNVEKIDSIVVPVIKELREQKTNRQTRLEEFFPVTPKKHKSVRVQNATRGGRKRKKTV